MIILRTLVGIDVVVALIAVVFFFIGVADGTVSTSNIAPWVALLGGLAAIVFGSLRLAYRGYRMAGTLLAGILAVPATLLCLGLVIAMTSGVRWN